MYENIKLMTQLALNEGNNMSGTYSKHGGGGGGEKKIIYSLSLLGKLEVRKRVE
jgi:hypothetical protein